MKVYITQADHPYVPGNPMTAHHTHEGAVAAAVDLVNIILKDTPYGKPGTATPKNWENKIARLQEIHGAQYCDVWITELEVKP